MSNIKFYEMNTNTQFKSGAFAGQTKLHEKSKLVEACSSLFTGKESKVSDAELNASYAKLKELGERSLKGDTLAKYELNEIQRYVIAPQITELIKLPSFLGSFKQIAYNEQPKIYTYKTENNDPRFQASGGDFNLTEISNQEYPLATQTLSAGYSVDYRQVASGNFDHIQYGLEETKSVMMNKVMTYVVKTIYDKVKASGNIKYFYEQAGITQAVLDKAITNIRRFGNGSCSLVGDFEMVSQINDLQGFTTGTGVKMFSEEVMNEFRRMGYSGQYKGANVLELQNRFNTNSLNTAGDNFRPYIPTGLMFVTPQGQTNTAIQSFARGGVTSANALDIITGKEITRFDLEFATEVVKGREYEIGIISDTNKDTVASYM